MINSSKAFRKLVIEVEEAFKRGSLNGVFVLLDKIEKSIKSPTRAVKLCTLIERIIQNRSGHLTFERVKELKTNLKLRHAINEQRTRNQIRKQEEAPEVKTKGAESSSDFVCIECVHCGGVDEQALNNTIHGLVCRDCLGV
ncbi:hypothetical protein QNF03_002258 [Vibrio cidicii]|nr:hypothetical protein [Vibrio cidicii]